MPRSLRSPFLLSSLLGLAASLAGCSERTAEPGSGKGPGSASQPAAVAPPPLRETYETVSWQGSPVGTIRTAYHAETLDGRPVVRIETSGTLSFLRFGQKVEQQIRDIVWETAAGEVVRFESFLLAGSAPQIVTGTVADGEATVTLRTAGKTQIERLQWPPGTGGSTATLDSLRRKPLQPGDSRKLTAFMPILNRVATVTMTARERETIDVSGAKRELLRVDSQTLIPGSPPLDAILWCDAAGETWKTEVPSIGQISIRTMSPEKIAAAPTFDIGTLTMVRVAPPLADAHHTQLVRYKVRLRDGDAAASFLNGASQVVKKLDDGATEIAVTAVRPTTPLPTGYTPTPPTESDRRPSALVQSDDPDVKKLAQAAGGNDADPWDVAARCEKLISEKMRSVDFSTAFATAAETAKTLTGDCTEHAVLLCAVLRARGIPARAAIGLVYVEREHAFGYHMWTEAWINDRWVPLDATLGRGGISAAYLKIADTNFDGVDAFASFLPVFPLLGRLQIEVLERK